MNPDVQKPLEDTFDSLRAEYPTVEWLLLTNQNFTEQMVKPTLEKSSTVADTSELFVRAAKLLELTGILSPKDIQQTRTASTAQTTRRATIDARVPSVSTRKLQPLVQDLMSTLLVSYPALLDETDRLDLMDREYCKRFVGLQIGNLPLLRRVEDGIMISGRARYYEKPYGEFYVCSEWWKDHHADNARSLLKLVTKIAERKAGSPGTVRLEKHRNALRDYLG